MKTLKTLSLLLLVTLFAFSSCKKNDDENEEVEENEEVVVVETSAMVDGETFEICSQSSFCEDIYFSFDTYIEITLRNDVGSSIIISVEGEDSGIYEFGTTDDKDDAKYVSGKQYVATSGQINISEINIVDGDIESMKATFSFVGEDSEGNKVTVTDGVINFVD